MAVIEVGIIVDGLPVFQIDYHIEANHDAKLADPALRSGLFSAIQSFAQDAFSDDLDELRLKNITITIKTGNIQGQGLALYAVADKDTRSMDSVRDALSKVSNRVVADGRFLDTLQPAKNLYLRDYFDKEFRDLRMKPAERARRLFG